jgi:hypothetical protein
MAQFSQPHPASFKAVRYPEEMDIRRFCSYDRVGCTKLSRISTIPDQNTSYRFIMAPMGGLTQAPPAADASYVTFFVGNQYPFARGSVVRLRQSTSEPSLTS